jgi:hypothetical protein
MKWRDLTPEQLRSVAADLFDDAHDDEVDREFIINERGFDAVAAMKAVARRLQREAARRERKASA